MNNSGIIIQTKFYNPKKLIISFNFVFNKFIYLNKKN